MVTDSWLSACGLYRLSHTWERGTLYFRATITRLSDGEMMWSNGPDSQWTAPGFSSASLDFTERLYPYQLETI